ncbi:MAG: phage holin family protein [Bacteroidota bacterium]
MKQKFNFKEQVNKQTIGRYLLKLLVSTLAVFITSHILPGVEIAHFTTAVFVAVTLSLLNTFLKPLLILLTIPLTLFTLGFFLLFINAFIILMASDLIEDFKISGFGTAMLFSILLSLITFILENINKPRIEVHIHKEDEE